MSDMAEKRGKLIGQLEEALALADEIEDFSTGYQIERVGAAGALPAREG